MNQSHREGGPDYNPDLFTDRSLWPHFSSLFACAAFVCSVLFYIPGLSF